MKKEFRFIEELKRKIPRNLQGPLGIGDDAGELPGLLGKKVYISADALVEGVDFIWGKLGPEKVGRKVLAINLSDMAAMGAKPYGFVITIGKPKRVSEAWLRKFYEGLLKLARKYQILCLGGDFSKSKEFFSNVTILGAASSKKTITRSGAKAGDLIAVTGALGGSLSGHHFSFTPRVAEGMFLAQKFLPTSMIDISDGLLQDLGHVLKASKKGAEIHLDKIPVSKAAKTMKGSGLHRALSDGEDFELLFTVPARKKSGLEKAWKRKFSKVRLSWIGKIVKGKPKINWYDKESKVKAPKLAKTGFSHF